MIDKEKYMGEAQMKAKPTKKLKLIIEDEAVKTRHIESKAVVTEKIADDAIHTDQIANKNVTSQKLADGAVTPDKLSPEAAAMMKGISVEGNIDHFSWQSGGSLTLSARTANGEGGDWKVYKNNSTEVFIEQEGEATFSFFDNVLETTTYLITCSQGEHLYKQDYQVAAGYPCYGAGASSVEELMNSNYLLCIAANDGDVAGAYNFKVQNTPNKFMVMVPTGVGIRRLRMNGIDVPMESEVVEQMITLHRDAETKEVLYKIYSSVNTYDVALYKGIQINEYVGEDRDLLEVLVEETRQQTEENIQAIDDLEESVGQQMTDLQETVEGQVSTLQETVEGQIEDLQETDETLQSNYEGIITTLQDFYTTFNTQKADKATTLDGYGILDAYTKSAVDAMIAALQQGNVVIVADHTAVASPQENTIYREPGEQSYTDWMYYDDHWYALATYTNELETEGPKKGSDKLITSGAVYNIGFEGKYYYDVKALYDADLVSSYEQIQAPATHGTINKVSSGVEYIGDASACKYPQIRFRIVDAYMHAGKTYTIAIQLTGHSIQALHIGRKDNENYFKYIDDENNVISNPYKNESDLIKKYLFTVKTPADINPYSIIIQFGIDEPSVHAVINQLCVCDLGYTGSEVMSVDSIKNMLVESQQVLFSNDFCMLYSKIIGAPEALTPYTSHQFEIWGDSLVRQGFGNYMGLDYVTHHGFGGKTSTYVRDQFLNGVTNPEDKSFIILAGRNNYAETDVIVSDIKAMVKHIGHERFMICMPPNGNYGEGKDHPNTYAYFTKLSEKLSSLYPNNFIDTRRACIEEYDMGDVRLEQSFTQPAIGGTVKVYVSDVAFLTTYNTGDVGQWGETHMKKIAIGINLEKMDIYKVIIANTEENSLILQLETNNSDIHAGGTVENIVGAGGETPNGSSVKYLRVLQNADYYCYQNDITQSTFRKDGIHMSERGQRVLAEVVKRFIVAHNL